MSLLRRRRGPSQFERAADGQMTLLEHLQELRGRLFKAALGIVAGMVGGWFIAPAVMTLMERPYCDLQRVASDKCNFVQLGVTDTFALQMKIALYIGLIIAAPIWLYQLWGFIAPGLHKHERRWAYAFVAVATPLFAFGAVLAYFVVAKGLHFLLSFTPANVVTTLEITRYIGFVTNLVLLFGLAFEFPLVVVLFNIAGIASAKRLLGWWRIAVFAFFVFSAIAVPTADPFGMSALGLCLSALYFGAVGFAFVNDRRRNRRRRENFGDLDDEEISPLDYHVEAVEAGEPVDAPEPVSRSRSPQRSYDDMT